MSTAWQGPTTAAGGSASAAEDRPDPARDAGGAAAPATDGALGGAAARRVLGNAAALLLAYVLPRLFTFAAAVAAARVLGAGEFGAYSTAAAFAVILSIVATLGMTPLLIRDMARSPAAAPRLVAAAHAAKTGANALMLAALLLFADVVLGYPPPVVAAALLLGVGYAIAAYAENLAAYFQAVERMHVWTQASAAFGLVTGILGIVAVVATRSVVWFCAAHVAGQAAALGWLLLRAPPEVRRPPRAARGDVARLLRALRPFAVAFLLLTLYYKLDVLLLARWRPAAEVGIYAAAYKFVDVAQALTLVAAGAVFPRLSRAAERAGAGSRWAGTRVAELALAAAVPAAAVLWLLRGPVILTIYGSAYAPAAAVLERLAAVIPALALNIVAGYVLGAAGGMRKVASAYAVGVVLNLALNAVLIPAWGAPGAATAMLGSELALSLLLVAALRREAAAAPGRRAIGAAMAAAAGCAALALAVGPGPLAAALYLPGVAFLYGRAGVWPRDARRAFWRAIRTPRGRPAGIGRAP